MAILDPIKAEVLAVRLIPNLDRGFGERLKEQYPDFNPSHRSLGLITATIDDVLYASIDEGTKMADVEVVYARSFYAGSAHASGPLSGEIIAMFSGPDPAEVRAGLNATISYVENEAFFYSANEDNSLAFFAHTISSTGSYLSKAAAIPRGQALAYLIAPPLEATYALDAALKAADVEMRVWYNPPSETNFSGGLLTGTQSACRAACGAFRDAVLEVARSPLKF
jgi:ethanolamine utilization protein EutL